MSCASRLARWSLTALGTGTLLVICQGSSPARPLAGWDDRTLSPGERGLSLARGLRGGETHVYRLDLARDQFVDLTVDQQGIDVIVRLDGPDGQRQTEVDSPNGTLGPEPAPVLAGEPGLYRLMVRSLEPQAPPGRYVLRLGGVRMATPDDRALVAAERAWTRGEELRRSGERASLKKALQLDRQALAGFRALGRQDRAADVLYSLGDLHLGLRDEMAAHADYQQALALFREQGRALEMGSTLNSLGQVTRLLGRPGEAVDLYQEALEIHQRLEEHRGEAVSLTNLARAWAALGEVESALSCSERALVLWRLLGERAAEGVTLSNLGHLYGTLGDTRRALDFLQRALLLLEAEGQHRDVAVALARLGVICGLAGRASEGVEPLRRALRLQRKLGDHREEAVTLSNLGWLQRRLGQLGAARRSYAQALPLFRSLKDRISEAAALSNLGWIETEEGRLAPAFSIFARVLPVFAETGDRPGEAATLLGLAHALRRRGDLEEALVAAESALRRIESLRSSPASGELRSRFFASTQDYYSLAIELRMDLHRRNPEGGHAERALEVAEAMKARSLLERLTGTEAPSLASAPLLRADEIQLEATGPETILLEYALGEERSYVWAITAQGFAVFELPPRTVIEDVACHAHALLSANRRTLARQPAEMVLAELSHLLLDPVADQLAGRRIVVVPDGALHYIPFAALPVPATARRGDGEPLMALHEVVSIPSVSVVAALRRELAGRRPQPNALAVVADPVFDAADPRLPDSARMMPAAFHERGLDGSGFPRLPYSRREAAAILALAPGSGNLAAFDFSARRELVTGGGLTGYRIVHFSTHGVFAGEPPGRSGIVLSRVNSRGRPQEGFVSAREISRLDLPADLVVLSACATALGEEIRGEGLVGLTQGFFQAGTRQVLVTLWPVEGQATAELMRRFYEEMLRNGLPPAAALRAAQSSLREEPFWSDPHFWAGFILQGDWQSNPGSLTHFAQR
jgi:CHAT domain-containing protein